MGTPVLIEDWENAIREFLQVNSEKIRVTFDSIAFARSIKELENTFIKTKKDSKIAVAVSYQNPSIQDFLINYFLGNRELQHSIIKSALFTDQFFEIFTTETEEVITQRKIVLDNRLIESVLDRLSECFSDIKSCRVHRTSYDRSEQFSWERETHYIYSFLRDVFLQFASVNTRANKLVYREFQERVYLDDYYYSEQKAYLDLMGMLKLKDLNFNEGHLTEVFLANTHWIENLALFPKFKKLFPGTYKMTIAGRDFNNTFNRVVREAISDVDDSDISTLIEQINELNENFNINVHDFVNELEERNSKYADYIDSQIESYIYEERDGSNVTIDEDKVIRDMFSSLTVK